MPLKRNSRGRLEGVLGGIGESVPGCMIDVEDSSEEPSVQSHIGRVRRKARPEQ